MTTRQTEDLVLCKCNSDYRSATDFSTVDGVKKIVTLKSCPNCGRNDNFRILTSTKEERVPVTQEEDIAWSRLEAEHETRPHYAKDCFVVECEQCRKDGYRPWLGK